MAEGGRRSDARERGIALTEPTIVDDLVVDFGGGGVDGWCCGG